MTASLRERRGGKDVGIDETRYAAVNNAGDNN